MIKMGNAMGKTFDYLNDRKPFDEFVTEKIREKKRERRRKNTSSRDNHGQK